MHEKKFNLLLIFYIFFPISIFFAGWLQTYISIPLIILLFIGCYRMIVYGPSFTFYSSNPKRDFIILIIISFFIVYLSGIGKLVYQNSDHEWRNAIYECLVKNNWPVIKEIHSSTLPNKKMLIYYFGFWLPSALIGKIFGINAGYIFQYIWAVLGFMILFILINNIMKQFSIKHYIIFFAFSGLDIVGSILLTQNQSIIIGTSHLEWWSTFQFSSNITLLFWVYNQAIYAWILTSLILLQNDNKIILALLSTSLIYCTLPFIGLIPITIYKLFNNFYEKNNSKNFRFKVKELISFENAVIGGSIGIISFMFLNQNSNNSYTWTFLEHDFRMHFFVVLFFYFIEVGIYIFFIIMSDNIDKMICLALIELFIIPFFQINDGYDFCMRASIPALFILYIYIIKSLNTAKKKTKLFLICVILIGSITPLHEINRTIYETYSRYINNEHLIETSISESNLFENSQYYSHYSDYIDYNIFFNKYILKKNKGY